MRNIFSSKPKGFQEDFLAFVRQQCNSGDFLQGFLARTKLRNERIELQRKIFSEEQKWIQAQQ